METRKLNSEQISFVLFVPLELTLTGNHVYNRSGSLIQL